MTDKARLSVLLDDPSQLADKLAVIARVVATTLGEHPTDVAQRVRYGGGIVVRDAAEPYAREITRGLAALGLGSFLVPQGELFAPPRPRRIGHLEVGADGLVLGQRLRAPEPVQWSRVLALHAHAILEPLADAGDVGPARRGGDLTRLGEAARRILADLRALEDKERGRVTLGVDLLVGGDAGPACYRLASDDPGIYGSLPNRSTIALENYLALVALLVGRAPPGVLVARSTRRFVVTSDVGLILFAKREELEAFTTWTLQALAAGVAGGAEPEDLADEGLEDADEALVVGEAGVAPLAAAEGVEADEVEDLDEGSDDAVDEGSDDTTDGDAADEDEDEDDEGDDEPLAHSADDLDDADVADDGDLAGGADAGGAAADPEVRAQAALFDKTGRFAVKDVKAIVADARALDAPLESADPDVDAEVREVAGMFDASSGRWDVTKVLAGDEVDAKDLEAAERDGPAPTGSPPPPA